MTPTTCAVRLKMSRFSASLRRSLTACCLASVRCLVTTAAADALTREALEQPSAVPGSRIHIIGRRKEQEVDISEALRALRAYSITTAPETVAVDITVDMTLKKVRINWSDVYSVSHAMCYIYSTCTLYIDTILFIIYTCRPNGLLFSE